MNSLTIFQQKINLIYLYSHIRFIIFYKTFPLVGFPVGRISRLVGFPVWSDLQIRRNLCEEPV